MPQTVLSIGVLVASANKVLLVKHTEKAGHLTDTYGLPAGRLEENEEAIDGAIRELAEETGLIVTKENLVPLPHIFEADILRKTGETAHFKWNVFVAKEFLGEIRNSEETIPEWVEISKVSKLNLLPNTQTAIEEGMIILNT